MFSSYAQNSAGTHTGDAFAVRHEAAPEVNGLPLQGERSISIHTREGTWLALDVSPDGKHLVFAMLGDLYELPIAGGKARQLTSGIAFDCQPKYSPDGTQIAFISDRDGAENIHLYDVAEGKVKGQLTHSTDEYYQGLSWSPDGNYLVIAKGVGLPKLNLYHKDGGSGRLLTAKPEDIKAIEPVFDGEGKRIWFSKRNGMWDYNARFPQYSIASYSLGSGAIEEQISRYGSAFSPTPSPDGKWLVYGTRYEEETALVLRNTETGEEEWLAYPVQHDDQESLASTGVLPAMSFTPDSKTLIANYGGKIYAITIATKKVREIPFEVDTDIRIGPKLDFKFPIEDTPDFKLTQIRDVSFSPDGKTIAFTALDKLYTAKYPEGKPERMTEMEVVEAQPAWSPDGKQLAFVTWDEEEGAIYTVNIGNSAVKKLTTSPNGFYQEPVWSPDGQKIVFYKGFANGYKQSTHNGKEAKQYLSWISAGGGEIHDIMKAKGANPHFSEDASRIYLFDRQKGLISVNWQGEDEKEHIQLKGFTSYAFKNNHGGEFQFYRTDAKPSRIIKSPVGNYALAQISSQLYLVTIPETGGEAPLIAVKDVKNAAFPSWKLTQTGAEFPSWSADGKKIYWALGTSVFSYEVSQKNEEKYAAIEEEIPFRVPRDIPQQELLLQNARIITMNGDEVIPHGDILIKNNRITTVGATGTIPVSSGITVLNLEGKTVVPGFFDMHAHMPVARGIHNLQPFAYASQLAYGVTTIRDPQSGTSDIFTYNDLVRTGKMLGPRLYTTGPGVGYWGYNVESLDHARQILRQYSKYYNTKTLKMYAVGNRKQRQWIIMAAKEQGLLPTTEGNLDMKLNLTEILDGYPGHEHAYPVFPFYKDYITFVAESGIAFTSALLLGYGGPNAENLFYETEDVLGDSKLKTFSPKVYIDQKARRRRSWFARGEYVFKRQGQVIGNVLHAGGLPAIGGHGMLQGLGYHWELWLNKADNISNLEVLQMATINGARAIGLDEDLGSVTEGKIADLVVMNKNPLEDIRNTNTIEYVIKNGRVYEAETLKEIMPDTRKAPTYYWLDSSMP
ncbi:amidohydrolase family protein [Sinomicrobium soli]|uniref:amidohydrolase family protein n=1 Tax=Sinomicrobium sp. N-1-3-6 TaxID=2219864 RepID=UPI001F3D7C6B|nr:amidohydrolase family protein [Sinomicrobium sp. N-1-3-6]